MSGIGREWPTLTSEERLDALRNHVLSHEVLIKALLAAVERLGVTFTWGDEPLEAGADDEREGDAERRRPMGPNKRAMNKRARSSRAW